MVSPQPPDEPLPELPDDPLLDVAELPVELPDDPLLDVAELPVESLEVLPLLELLVEVPEELLLLLALLDALLLVPELPVELVDAAVELLELPLELVDAAVELLELPLELVDAAAELPDAVTPPAMLEVLVAVVSLPHPEAPKPARRQQHATKNGSLEERERCIATRYHRVDDQVQILSRKPVHPPRTSRGRSARQRLVARSRRSHPDPRRPRNVQGLDLSRKLGYGAPSARSLSPGNPRGWVNHGRTSAPAPPGDVPGRTRGLGSSCHSARPR